MAAPQLLVELVDESNRYVAHFRGDLVGETVGVVQAIEPILENETHVLLDFSGVRSLDRDGVSATLEMVERLNRRGSRRTLQFESLAGSWPLRLEYD